MDTLLQVAASWILPALFFWFLFSLIAMTIIEFIQRFTKSRQRGLEEVIETLLGRDLRIKFYQHSLVNPLGDKKPSYISPALFAKVVMEWLLKTTKVEKARKIAPVDPSAAALIELALDWLVEKTRIGKSDVKETLNEIIQENIRSLSQGNPQLGEVLQTIVAQADVKTDKDAEFLELIQKDLEAWFWEAVGQMTSVYGARLQMVTLSVSLAIAAISNFDVIGLTVRLWETSKYTELLALYEKTQQPFLVDQNLFLTLPIGWYGNNVPTTLNDWVLKIAGIYLGAFFIAIGSQYVFNLMKKQYKPSKESDTKK